MAKDATLARCWKLCVETEVETEIIWHMALTHHIWALPHIHAQVQVP